MSPIPSIPLVNPSPCPETYLRKPQPFECLVCSTETCVLRNILAGALFYTICNMTSQIPRWCLNHPFDIILWCHYIKNDVTITSPLWMLIGQLIKDYVITLQSDWSSYTYLVTWLQWLLKIDILGNKLFSLS